MSYWSKLLSKYLTEKQRNVRRVGRGGGIALSENGHTLFWKIY